MPATDAVTPWGRMILSLIVGLLALSFFLALGGVFALVGPWIIFVVAQFVSKRSTLVFPFGAASGRRASR
jgi:hypothetical protein